MSAPTVTDAILLLTDPDLRAEVPEEDELPGYVQMRGSEIIDRLAGPDDDRVNARTLVAEALMQIGGLDRSGWRSQTTEGAGRRRRGRDEEFVEDYWTPETRIGGRPG